MDIIIRLDKKVYLQTRADTRDYYMTTGYVFRMVKKQPKKLIKYDKMYFIHNDKLVGYGINHNCLMIDDEVNSEETGRLYRHLGMYIIGWKKHCWYEKAYECGIIKKPDTWKYFDLKRWLKGRKESEIIKEG